MEKVTLDDAFDSFDEPWAPRLAGELNGQELKLAKAEGEFIRHSHADADELFLVVDGRLRIEFPERPDDPDVVLEPGELLVVPRGVEHRPVAEPTAELLLFEPAGTENTGDAESELSNEVRRLE